MCAAVERTLGRNIGAMSGSAMLARSQLRIIIVASLAGLLFGFDTAVISGVTHDLREAFSLSAAGLGIAVSTALWVRCSVR